MTETEIDKIITDGKLTEDELDNFWENIAFLIFSTSILGISVWSVFKNFSSGTLSFADILFASIASVIFVCAIWYKRKEKNLKTVETDLKTARNIDIVNELIKNNNWQIDENSNSYFEVSVLSIFRVRTHKLTIICTNNRVLFNLRNTGSHAGRMPFTFGIDTYK